MESNDDLESIQLLF